MKNMKPTIVVGVDGTRASLAALQWAADEARRRGAGLRVVHGWDREFYAPYAPPEDAWSRAQHQADATASLTAQLGAVFGPDLPDTVSAEIAEGIAERILVDRSAGADLLVLGSASGPPAAGRAIGSVTRACLRRAFCPVVVVSIDQRAAGRTMAHLAELAAEGDRVALQELNAVLATEPAR